MEVCRDSEDLVRILRKQRNAALEAFEKALTVYELDDKLTNRLWAKDREEANLWCDVDCQCGFTSEDGVLKSRFACRGCRALAAVSNFSNAESLIIMPVDEIDTYVLLDRHPAFRPQIKYTEQPIAILTQLLARQHLLEQILSRPRRSVYIEADPFSTLLLLSWSIDRIRRKADFPMLENFSGLICGKNGIRITQSGQTLQQFTEQNSDQLEEKTYYSRENLTAILFQVILQLQLYTRHYITLGSVNLDFLRTTADESSYKINGKRYQFPISVFLEPSLYSSGELFLTDVIRARLANNCLPIEKALERLDHCPKFNLEKEKDVLYLVLDLSSLHLLLSLRAYGLPILLGSLDMACLFFALMCYRPFHKALSKNEKLLTLWKSCWRPGDFQTIDSRINNFYNRKTPTAEQVQQQLVGCSIRVDLVEYLTAEIAKF
jgi:hypothetical protein